MTSEWIKTSDKLPEAVYGPEGEQPHLSDDVLLCFGYGVALEIGNFDHETGNWTLVHGDKFVHCPVEPLYWHILPDIPPESAQT